MPRKEPITQWPGHGKHETDGEPQIRHRSINCKWKRWRDRVDNKIKQQNKNLKFLIFSLACLSVQTFNALKGKIFSTRFTKPRSAAWLAFVEDQELWSLWSRDKTFRGRRYFRMDRLSAPPPKLPKSQMHARNSQTGVQFRVSEYWANTHSIPCSSLWCDVPSCCTLAWAEPCLISQQRSLRQV